ncbi:RHS repeat-associated core domain-containing protein [Treponema denticola]|nr:RHS repeat-associated core domain-containing protein [Treponema denticola]
MKAPFYLYLQLGHFISRTAIEAEILFAVCLIKKQALTGGKSLARENKYSKKIGAESVVLHFVFFMIIINKMQQSAKTKLLLNSPTDMPFGNRWSRYKEPSKNKAEAYRVYVEHLFLRSDAGDARIFSKEMTHTDNQGDNEEQKAKQYYYHSDHLGSAQFVTDWKGRQYEHIEYTPYGELWIEEVAAGLDKLPFRFTGKELDEETGLYYYGARYLDPKYSRWLSGDPALGEYIPKAPIDDEAKKHNENLPGMGGIYNTVNLHVYHYAGNNPVKYTDPNGKSLDVVDNGNGTYTVCGGIENSDKNIYLIVNGQRTGDVIGVMFTEHSFFDGGKVVAGAVINPNDSSGQEFLNDFKENTPSLFSYMPEGLNGKKYDFKDRGIGEGDNEQIYRHRGMPLGVDENGNKIFGTARDVGNYAAGYIAGKNSLSWREARFGFDALQSAMDSIRNRSITISTEGPESQAAQYKGFIDGKANFNNAWKDLDIMF